MVKLLDEGGVFSFSFISGPRACLHLFSCILQELVEVCQLFVLSWIYLTSELSLSTTFKGIK